MLVHSRHGNCSRPHGMRILVPPDVCTSQISRFFLKCSFAGIRRSRRADQIICQHQHRRQRPRHARGGRHRGRGARRRQAHASLRRQGARRQRQRHAEQRDCGHGLYRQRRQDADVPAGRHGESEHRRVLLQGRQRRGQGAGARGRLCGGGGGRQQRRRGEDVASVGADSVHGGGEHGAGRTRVVFRLRVGD
ncbi:hypothetical protein CRV24_001788 [Beauveria bassiana]|nr:hypothetical protein CRV24_001788 [Beauveria bassiana]